LAQVVGHAAQGCNEVLVIDVLKEPLKPNAIVKVDWIKFLERLYISIQNMGLVLPFAFLDVGI